MGPGLSPDLLLLRPCRLLGSPIAAQRGGRWCWLQGGAAGAASDGLVLGLGPSPTPLRLLARPCRLQATGSSSSTSMLQQQEVELEVIGE